MNARNDSVPPKRDDGDFEQIYVKHFAFLQAIATHKFGVPASEAETLVHEVFLSLHKRCASFDPTKGTARSWLVHLTYNKCFDWREYLRARHGFREGNGEGKSPATPSELIEEQCPTEFKISGDDIRALLASLPREQQLTFQMRVAGYTFSEIGEKLGCSPGNAKHHAYRGIQRLRRIVFDGNKPGPNQVAKRVAKLQAKSMFQ